MDDPLLVVAGSRSERVSKALQALLLWRALRARVAWRKGNYGSSVQWIGGQLSLCVTPGQRSTEQSDQGYPSPEQFAVRVSLPSHKVQALLQELCSINACPRGMVYRDRLRSLAGLGSWIAGLAPQVKPFIRQIWAAIATPVQSSSSLPVVHKFMKGTTGAAPKLVYRKQTAAALQRLELFALGKSVRLV